MVDLNASTSNTEASNADTDVARTLAALADLPLAPGRAEIAGELFAEWLPAANELSRKMSAAEHTTLLPATVFTHAPLDEES